jgi:hypothetical protein
MGTYKSDGVGLPSLVRWQADLTVSEEHLASEADYGCQPYNAARLITESTEQPLPIFGDLRQFAL